MATTGSASMARDRRHDRHSARTRGASPGHPGPSWKHSPWYERVCQPGGGFVQQTFIRHAVHGG